MLVNQSIISDLKAIIAQSNDRAVRAVDHQRTLMYWHIGKRIFEEEQQSKDRADYGSFLIKYLSEKLQPEFGSGFSVRQMNLYRQFYRTFPIVHALHAQLSWTQYKLLLSVAIANFEKVLNRRVILFKSTSHPAHRSPQRASDGISVKVPTLFRTKLATNLITG
ncbi:DUF1016 N-terminal domain-containing protein [Pedobacter sp. D749]|uniref:DUF1016 N-terminal domain-containing protein n=1 Tax=Pedobacter sp. D749 TaxID=2856523 RepID=UPI002103140A|nr:DUF1016 N-terminal domain-containing protein [Pedobacter sp. D749]